MQDIELQKTNAVVPAKDEGKVQPEEKDAEEEQVTFGKSIEYWLSCIGYAVGFGNIWRFPYLVFQNGGAVFLIPYLVALVTIAIPMYAVETAYGQVIRCRLNEKFSILKPVFWGIGLTQFLVDSLTCLYYITLIPWVISYLFYSFQDPLPWKGATLKESIWNKDFFHNTMLQKSEHISEDGYIVPRMFWCQVLAYAFIYYAMRKSIKSSSKMLYVLVPLPYFLMSILLVKGLTLDGAGIGLKYLFKPDFSKLGDLKIWESALVQILYSSGVSIGPLLFYGSARPRDSKIMKSSLWLPIINSATSLFAALTIFSFIGYVSKELDIPIQDISEGGQDLAFIAYPGLMTTLKWPNLWSITFFTMLFTVGIDSVFAIFDFSVAFLWDLIPSARQKMRKEWFVLIVTLVYFTCGLIFVTNNGYWHFNIFNDYAAGLALIFVLVAETALICFVLGLDRLDALIFHSTGERLPKAVKFCVKYISLPVMTAILIIGFYNEFSGEAMDPRWTQVMGRSLTFVPIGLAFLGLIWAPKTTPIETLVEQQFGMKYEQTAQVEPGQKAAVDTPSANNME